MPQTAHCGLKMIAKIRPIDTFSVVRTHAQLTMHYHRLRLGRPRMRAGSRVRAGPIGFYDGLMQIRDSAVRISVSNSSVILLN